MKFAKRFAFCAAAITCAAMFPAAADAAQDLLIGVIVPTTGALAPLGIDMKNGYELAVKDHPTVKGKPVRLVIEDDQGNAATGLMKAQKLVIKDRAPILVGGAGSALVLGLAAQAERLNVPIVTTNEQAVQVTGAQWEMARFVKAYTATFGNVPGPQAIQAYAGMRLMLAAMDAAPSMSAKDLISSLYEQWFVKSLWEVGASRPTIKLPTCGIV